MFRPSTITRGLNVYINQFWISYLIYLYGNVQSLNIKQKKLDYYHLNVKDFQAIPDVISLLHIASSNNLKP